nr:hypothetical protein [Gemmatimonadota bacterium]
MVEAHRADSLDVAGAGAEGEAVQRVKDLLVGGLLAVCGGRSLLGVQAR